MSDDKRPYGRMDVANVPPQEAPAIPVKLEEPVMTGAEAMEFLRDCGVIDVGGDQLKKLASLGAYAKTVGIVKTQNGRAVVSQERLNEAILYLLEMMREIKANPEKTKAGNKRRTMEMAKIAQQLGYLTARLTESQRMVLEASGAVLTPNSMPPEQEEEPVAGFLPRQPVRPGTTNIFTKEVHIAGNGAKPGD